MKKKLMLGLVLVVVIVALTGCGVSTDVEPITPETASGWWQTLLVLPLVQFITWLNGVFGNLGVAIIIATIVTKALVMPLMVKSMNNSAKVQELQPEMDKIKKKYAGKTDRDSQMKMNQEMSLLYRERGINPMAGCLPMLIQMPLMFAFFQAFSRHPLIVGVEGAYFLGMNLSAIQEIPNIIFAALVAGLMYYSQSRQQSTMQGGNQQAAQTTKMMNVMFLPMMATMVYFSPLAMGLYFLVSQIMMTIQSFILKRPGGTAF
jgi:YidC/Oxa1 family membrane protein insertase